MHFVPSGFVLVKLMFVVRLNGIEFLKFNFPQLSLGFSASNWADLMIDNTIFLHSVSQYLQKARILNFASKQHVVGYLSSSWFFFIFLVFTKILRILFLVIVNSEDVQKAQIFNVRQSYCTCY